MKSHLTPLLALKANVLKSLAVSIGVNSTGTKAKLAARIVDSCCGGVGFFDRSMEDGGGTREGEKESRGRKGKAIGQTGGKTKRVLSIDMGIRNMAMCVIEVPNCGAVPAVEKKKKRAKPRKKRMAEALPKVIAWERIAVAERPPEGPEVPEAPEAPEEPETPEEPEEPEEPETDITLKSSRRKILDPDQTIVPFPQAIETDTTKRRRKTRKTPDPDFSETVIPPKAPETEANTPKRGRRKTPSPGLCEPIAPHLPARETDIPPPKNGRKKTRGPDSHEEITLLPPAKPKRARKLESFEPAFYAALTNNFVRKTLSQFSPDVILIEKQRYRSHGASAILEWTIRVNMFEAMLHAVFYSVGYREGTNRGSPAAESVSPGKVNRFWIDKMGERYLEKPREKKGSLSLEKRTYAKSKLAKISLVSEWIKRGDVISLDQGVAGMVEDFVPPEPVDGKRPPKKVNSGKLDDLADCLLQGMAWIRWEENRRSLAEGRLIPELLPCRGKKS